MALGLSGCRAAGMGSIWPRAQPALSQGSLDVEAFIAEHNRNAERIQSLEAKPSITVAVPRRPAVHVDGRMALERPQNFKLELSAAFGSKKVADIGSNDQEFWFWVQSEEDKSLYWCNYSDVGSSILPASYQPDWIIEALGLKPIAPDEAAQ